MDDASIDIYTTLIAANLIYSIFRVKELYSKDIDEIELINILNESSVILKDSLDKDVWRDQWKDKWEEIKNIYEDPVYENSAPPVVFLVVMAWGGDYFRDKDDQIPSLVEKIPDKLKKLICRFNEIRIFDCKFPDEKADPSYASRKRFFSMLQKYWEKYLDILHFCGTAPLRYTPHPLSRFITNLEFRVGYCVEKVEDSILYSAYSNLSYLDPIKDNEFSMYWEVRGEEECNNFHRALNEVLLTFGSGNLEMTEEETMFLEECDKVFEYFKKKTEQDFKNILLKTSKVREFTELTPKTKKEPETPGEYIYKVENTLRDITMGVYKKNYGEKWLEAIKDIIGEMAYLESEKRMKDRKKTELEDFLYFTNLNEIYLLVSQKWELFKDFFTIRRKDFNSKMAVVLKGRTEAAHNRPDHLWPKIEKDRVKVACHDLLESIKL